jgi:hypothetical protein
MKTFSISEKAVEVLNKIILVLKRRGYRASEDTLLEIGNLVREYEIFIKENKNEIFT